MPVTSVQRWTFTDTVTGPTGLGTWTMPINPNSMSAPPTVRDLRFGASVRVGRNRPRTFRTPAQAQEWSFSGVIRTQAHHDTLREWALSGHLIEIRDHLGRVFEAVITVFDPVDRAPTPTTPWRFTYTMKTLVLRSHPA